MEIDLSFSQAAVVMPVEYNTLRFIVVGAGGTGSFVVPAIARLIYELKQQQNKSAEMLIVDPDLVENGNIPRSNFCFAEIGRYKAQTLAAYRLGKDFVIRLQNSYHEAAARKMAKKLSGTLIKERVGKTIKIRVKF